MGFGAGFRDGADRDGRAEVAEDVGESGARDGKEGYGSPTGAIVRNAGSIRHAILN